MTNYEILLQQQQRKLTKALAHLQYSYNKILALAVDPEQLDEELLETWESFTARFARVADIFLNQYLRTRVLFNDPGFSGSFRDLLHYGEKFGFIDDANAWMEIRELRNINVHDYNESDLLYYFQKLKDECPRLLAIKFN